MNAEMTLPEDLFNPARMPSRDVHGYVLHPAYDFIQEMLCTDDEGFETTKYIEQLGYEFNYVSFEDDADDDVAARYFNDGDTNISAWNPSIPNGDGWSLFGIYDTEDGPYAAYIRTKQSVSVQRQDPHSNGQ